MKPLPQGLLAYLAAFLWCYLLAISVITTATLVDSPASGAKLGVGNIFRTWLADLWRMSPRWDFARYGTLILIALAIAMPLAAALHAAALHAGGYIDLLAAPTIFPLAGTVAMGTAVAILRGQLGDTPIPGTHGLGFWAQCVAGGIGGFAFGKVWAMRLHPDPYF
jgi:hypothetical protein